ncbi:heterokaryon incompatibility protein-domain-containing protein [Fusarium sp. MPI-SDFR-AT-0072]|nr:heterokaryon incompatibility protein-domain-containing protein [Fusarium sp. MPI-SDFR-AT-0072]
MSSKLCAPCREAFLSEPTRLYRDSTISYTPFHEAPWKAFQNDADSSRGINESVKDCDFCSFVVAFAAADQALGKHGNGSFAHDSKASRKAQGEPMLALWQYHMYTYEGHLSADLGLRRHNLRYIDGLDIRLFGTEDPRVKGHRSIEKTSTSTSSETSFDSLSKWIRNCSVNHKSCNKLHARTGKNRDWLPARLVKIIPNADGVPEIIKVVETDRSNDLPPKIEYATLSYCWGRQPFTKLLRSNIESMTTTGMPIKDLPATFRDAITVTNRLGLEYIWIDALCIIQLDAEDWSLHSVTMAKVYSYSAITLAAAAASDAHGGLFRERNPAGINGAKVNLKWPSNELEGEFYLVSTDPWEKAVAQSPLLKRAWVFQERLLSRGTVYFAHDMLYWECGELYASELYPEGGPWDLQYRYKRFDIADRLPSGVQSVEDYRFKHVYTELLTRELNAEKTVTDEEMFLYVWASVVAQYSVGKLSKETDKLIAIDGVAEQLTSIVPREKYLKGLWRQESLPLSLLWRTETEEKPPSTRVAPSWSWASVYTPVDFNFLFRAQTEPKVVTKAIDIITPDNEPESLEISRPTALVLQGPLTEVRFRSASRSALGPLHSNWWKSHNTMRNRIKFLKPLDLTPRLVFMGKGLKADYPCAIWLDREVPKNARIFALKIAEADIRHPWQERLPSECGLLLITDRERGTFRRIGMFEIAVEKMKRDWADQKTSFTAVSKLRDGIWSDSGIETRFYLEKDEKDGYTVKII